MTDTMATFTVVLRSSWGTESSIGTIAVDQGAKTSTIKATIASMLYAIAGELSATAYDGPTAPMPWLDHVDLVEFTDAVPRDRSLLTRAGRCGALPARAFRLRYPEGCVGAAHHDGNHCTDPVTAARAERRSLTLSACA